MALNNRIIQFDILRIIAAFAVVWLHTCAQRFYTCYPSIEWDIRNLYDSMVRWAVPIFVMISGALFLDSNRKINIKKLYTKSITRIIVIFFLWSIIYEVYSAYVVHTSTSLIIDIIKGPFHFWFFKMLIGLYISVPILRAIVSNQKLEIYFICLSVVTAFLPQMFFPIIGHISDNVRQSAQNYYESFGIQIASGYLGYFVLGHYLSNLVVKDSIKKVLYILGVLSFVSVFVLTYIVSKYIGTPCTFFYDYINLFTLFEALALFLFIKGWHIYPKYNTLIVGASKLSLGIYIIHPLVMSILYNLWKLDSSSLNPVYFIPIFAFIVFIISSFLTWGLIKIPIIKKIVM